jgi:hypothetical protein
MEILNRITHEHIGHAFLVGLAAGVMAYLINVYALGPLETTLGLPQGGI